MGWSVKGNAAKNRLKAWCKTPLGKTAALLGLKPKVMWAMGRGDPSGKWTIKPSFQEYLCLYVNDEEYMLLKMKHDRWYECWRLW